VTNEIETRVEECPTNNLLPKQLSLLLSIGAPRPPKATLPFSVSLHQMRFETHGRSPRKSNRLRLNGHRSYYIRSFDASNPGPSLTEQLTGGSLPFMRRTLNLVRGLVISYDPVSTVPTFNLPLL
jgi:hypothetical protein